MATIDFLLGDKTMPRPSLWRRGETSEKIVTLRQLDAYYSLVAALTAATG